jgi:hypothetical protein
MKTSLKHTILYLAAGALVFFASACDLSSLNEDPNNPTQVPVNLQLPALQHHFSYQVVAWAPRTPALWIQQLTASFFLPSAESYDVDESSFNNLWEFYGYPYVLNNSRLLAEQALEEGNPAYAGIAQVIHAWGLSYMTDLWGDIPYSEAFDPLNTTPAYDRQEEIYQVIFTTLDEAIANLGAANNNLLPGTSADFIYGGNLQQWTRLAYSLKARFEMRLSKAPGYNETTQAQRALDALANGLQSNADNAEFDYIAAPASENPWFQFAIDGKWDTRDQVGEYYINLLKELRDPRLPIHARPAGAVGNNGLVADFQAPAFDPEVHFSLTDSTFLGQPSGVDPRLGTVQASSIGAFFSAPGAALAWFRYPSLKFVEAEATLIVSGAAAAQPIFEDAIRADMERVGVAAADIAAYIASLPALTDAGVDAREMITTQKYIANFLDLEAYNDYRRVGYPDVPLAAPSANRRIDIIPLRFPTPASERQRNAASIPDYLPLGFNEMRVPVWWDTTVPAGALPNPTQ